MPIELMGGVQTFVNSAKNHLLDEIDHAGYQICGDIKVIITDERPGIPTRVMAFVDAVPL